MNLTSHFTICIHEDTPTLIMPKNKSAVRNVTCTVFFQSPALGKATKQKNQHTVIANWYTTKCLPPVAESVDVHGLATYDFWLFFNLEKHLREQSFTPENAIDEAPHQVFESISKDDLL